MNQFNLALDLDKSVSRTPPTVRLRQGDQDGTVIAATIYDHGAALGGTVTACAIVMKLPDGTHYYRKSATYSGGVATVTVDERQAASVVGRTMLAYFTVTVGTAQYSTGAFVVVVEPDAVGDAELPEDYDTAIQEAIDRCNAAAAAIEGALPIGTANLANGAVTSDKLADAVRKGYVRSFETVAAMQAATDLKAGMTCHTNGFHASGDGGAAYYTVSASGTANGMDVLALQGGLVAMHVPTSGWISVKQYGARGNGLSDDAAVIQTALDSNANVYFPRGTYVVKSALTVDRSKRISGDARGNTVLAFNNGTDGFVVNGNNVSFDNLNINGGSYSAGGTKSGIHFTATTPYFEVSKVNLFQFNKAIYSETFVGSIINCVANTCEYGFYLTGGPNIYLNHCYALDCLTGYYVTAGYSMLSGCACDRANVAYHVNGSQSLSVNSSGCEYCGTYMVIENMAVVTVTGGASHSYQHIMTPSNGANDFVVIRSQCVINGYKTVISGTSANETTVYSNYIDGSTVFMTGCVFQLPAYVSDDSSVYGYKLDDTNLITDATFVSKDTWTLTDSRWATYFDMPSSLVAGDVYEISCNIKRGDQTADINASKWLSGEIDGVNIDFGGGDVIDTNKSVQAYRFEVTETMANATKTRFYLRSTAGQPWYRRNWQCIKLPHKYTTVS